jgi:uncharacterized protein YndB with AHSA1/START domain
VRNLNRLFATPNGGYLLAVARNVTTIDVPPAAVFDVLADPDSYGRWVVGSSEIRDADAAWPAVGSRFHHSVGIGPLTVDDETEVEQVIPGRLLRLHAKARPLGTAHVSIELQPAGDGTRVTMIEDPGDRLTGLVFTPITHLLVRLRNAESLRRLAKLARESDAAAGAANARA